MDCKSSQLGSSVRIDYNQINVFYGLNASAKSTAKVKRSHGIGCGKVRGARRSHEIESDRQLVSAGHDFNLLLPPLQQQRQLQQQQLLLWATSTCLLYIARARDPEATTTTAASAASAEL